MILENVKHRALAILSLAALGSSPARATPPRPWVISASPQTTEILLQLRKADHVVAGSTLGLPPGHPLLPEIGAPFTPNLERVIRFEPDWIVLDGFFSAPGFERALRNLGMSVFRWQVASADSLLKESQRLLNEVFHESNAAALERAKGCLEKIRPVRSFRFLIFTWADPTILMGEKTLLSDLVRRAGGENLASVFQKVDYPQVSKEWLLKQHPQVVYYLSENELAARSYAALVKDLWPETWEKNLIHLRALPAAQFARTSFTPLGALSAIEPDWKVPHECRGF